MDRVQQTTAANAVVTLSVDEVATDPDTNLVTVSAVRLNGTSVFTGTAATRLSAGVYQVSLSPAHTALLDTLTLTWTYARSAQTMTAVTQIEVVGGFLVSLAALRRRLTDTVAFPTADLLSARTDAEQAIEDALGVAFVPRYAREQITPASGSWTGWGTQRVRVDHARPRSVRDVTVGGVAYTAPQIANLVINIASATVTSIFLGPTLVGYIGYEHGFDFPPRPVTDAALEAAVFYASNDTGSPNGVDPRATRVITQDGTIELGVGEVTSLPAVQAAIQRYRSVLIA